MGAWDTVKSVSTEVSDFVQNALGVEMTRSQAEAIANQTANNVAKAGGNAADVLRARQEMMDYIDKTYSRVPSLPSLDQIKGTYAPLVKALTPQPESIVILAILGFVAAVLAIKILEKV